MMRTRWSFRVARRHRGTEHRVLDLGLPLGLREASFPFVFT